MENTRPIVFDVTLMLNVTLMFNVNKTFSENNSGRRDYKIRHAPAERGLVKLCSRGNQLGRVTVFCQYIPHEQ